MNGAIYTITPEQAVRLFPDIVDESLDDFIRMSHPLLTGFYDDQPVCLVGLCPATLTSDTAYIWGWNTPAVNEHSLIYTRWARRLVARVLGLYPNLIGHCTRRKWKWLRSLGADLLDVNGDMFTFQIKAQP
jgi:hypothetical protein